MRNSTDNAVVFGWFFDFVCSELLEEFERSQTVDGKSGRQFLTGLLQYTLDDEPNRVSRVDFLQLLCVLADGDQPDLKFESNTSRRSKTPTTPLEHALVLLEKLQGSGTVDHLKEEVGGVQILIRTQAVMTFLRKGRTEEAREICKKLWPAGCNKTDEEEKLVENLTELCTGKKNKAFMTLHNLNNFYRDIIPVLRAINEGFGEPFLHKVLKRKDELDRQPVKDVISNGILKRRVGDTVWRQAMDIAEEMGKESNGHMSSPTTKSKKASSPQKSERKRAPSASASSSSSEWEMASSPKKGKSPSLANKLRKASSPHKNERKRPTTSASSSSSSFETETASPPKKGKSIRNVQYGKSKGERSARPDHRGQAVDWDLSDEDEEGQVSATELKSPKVRRSLDIKVRAASHGNDNERVPKKKPWTEEEEDELRRGIERYGVGRWADIKMSFNLDGRSNVNLKDKYRNWVKNGLI